MGPRWRQLGQAALTLTGIYAVHYFVTRVAVATVPTLAVVQPLKGLKAWLFTSWDAEHYLRLAQNYDSYAWPPLYPFVLGTLSATGLSVQAAAVLVNLAAHFAIVALAAAYVRGNPRLAEVPGWLFAGLILFFPGHNVFFAAYSESLFVALVLGACVAYQRERLWLAGVLCGFALLTRNMGVFLGAALVVVEALRLVRARPVMSLRRVAAVALWVPFFVGWNLWLSQVAQTDPVAATQEWQLDLLQNHVPPGMPAKLWVLRYVALPPGNHNEFVFFWASVVAAGFCWSKKLEVEAGYIAVFLVSFGFYLYRPFPFTRYVSTLFPLPLMVAHWTRRWPALQALTLGLAISFAHYYEVMLFSDRFGEP